MTLVFKKKTRQIDILKKEILASGLIEESILEEVEKLYLDNPYHNYLHALRVTSYVLLLDKEKFSALELRSMMIAGLFHDAGHTGTAMDLDEFTSLSHFRVSMDKFPDFIINDSVCRNAIIGTVFKNRGKNINRYAQIMSDLDIGDIGKGLVELLYYGSLFALELGVTPEVFYTDVEKGYFRYLIDVDRNIIISKEVREVLPNSYKTIKEFYDYSLEDKIKMYDCLLKEDITLQEFRERFFS